MRPADGGWPTVETCPACGAEAEGEDLFCEACGADLPGREHIATESATSSAIGLAAAPEPPPDMVGATPPTLVIEAVSAGTRCVHCAADASHIGPDGYCSQCGFKQPDPRDHLEEDHRIIAGVTDRGLHHHRNEDAMSIVVVGDPTSPLALVAVVCDGVSSTTVPEQASQLAADTACALLRDAVVGIAQAAAQAAATAAATEGSPPGTTLPPTIVIESPVAYPDDPDATLRTEPPPVPPPPPRPPANLAEAMQAAATAAQAGVVTIPFTPEPGKGSPSCTLAMCVLEPATGLLTAGWIGDSRVYWLAGAASERLTTDDSWASEAIEIGLMDQATAEADNRAHAITRWVGADAPTVTPHVVTFQTDGAGLALVCSDGLWNYVSEAPSIAENGARLTADADDSLLTLARALTGFAIDAGGHDNITVVLMSPAGAVPNWGAASTEIQPTQIQPSQIQPREIQPREVR